MSLAAIVLRYVTRVVKPRRAPRPISKAPVLTPSRCFEVLLPYVDPARSAREGLEPGARHRLTVRVWAPDVETARGCAREQWNDRVRHRSRSARLVADGPVVLGVVQAASAI
jgi:hypothetical protein